MMNRAEFIEKLKQGLGEVPPDERVAALQYYTEYFDDAGPEREEEVLAELGSPEEVAAMVRAESKADGWVPPEKPAPAEAAPPPVAPPQAPPAGPQPTAAAFGMGAAPSAPPPPGSQSWTPPPHGYGSPVPPQGVPVAPPPPAAQGKKMGGGTIALIVILCILFGPAVIGLAGGLFGALVGVLVALFMVLLVPLIVGVSLVAGGVFAIVVGSFGFSISLPTGFASIGIGVLLVGLGLLCTAGGGILLGKVIPAVFRGLGAMFRKIFRRGKKQAEAV